MMRVYSAANYQETKIMRAEEQTFLGEWNLSKLKGSKTAEFTVSLASRIPGSGKL